jgi:nucleotide-binding universal stress UspA family protein
MAPNRSPMRVLLATDGSASAHAAAMALRAFPLPAETTVRVLSVAHVPVSPLATRTLDQLQKAARAAAREAAEEARGVLKSRWPKAEAHVVDSTAFGDPREAILRASSGMDLVVLGARGLGAVRGFFLGSVSATVARDAPCSVLVVKGTPRPVRHALIGADGSPDATYALRFVEALGQGMRTVGVTVLGVVQEAKLPHAPTALALELSRKLNELHRGEAAKLRRAVTTAVGRLGSRVASLDVVIDVGRPGEALIAGANQPGCDLVVVGARDLGKLGRTVLGSVSEQVVHRARCPVLIVKRG